MPLTLAAVAILDTWLAGRPEASAHRARHVTKPMVVPLVSLELRGAGGPLARSARVGLAAGWAGDLALLGRGRGSFLAGLAAFAVGHAAYLSGLVGLRRRRPRRGPRHPRTAPLAVVAVGTTLGPTLAVAAGRRDPVLRLPVLAYATLLTATAAAACDLDPTLPAPARRRLAAGGLVFVVSDGVLAAREFVLTAPSPLADRTVMATYATAQWLLASGVARLGSSSSSS